MSSLQTAGRGSLAPSDASLAQPRLSPQECSCVVVSRSTSPSHAWPAVWPVLSPEVLEPAPEVEKVTFRTGHKSPRSSSSSCGPGDGLT